VSPNGGRAPLWAPNGRELFYQDNNSRLTAVSVQPSTNGTFNFGSSTTLLQTIYSMPQPTRGYDISRDGQKFLMIKQTAGSPDNLAAPPSRASIVVVLNWIEELKQRLPAK
jgi:hypothetical protein